MPAKPLTSQERLLAEEKREAHELLAKYGVPTHPPSPTPIPRVRIRLLQNHAIGDGAENERTFQAGDELVAEKDIADRYVEAGLAEVICPVTPQPVPEPQSYFDTTEPPYFEWFFEIADGRQPSAWRDLGIEIPPEEDRLGLLAALWNAALVHCAEIDLSIVEETRFRAQRGWATPPPETAQQWLTDTLLLRSRHFLASDAIRALEARHSARRAGGAPKFARGIQAAVNEVYRAGLTEQACWAALAGVDGQTFEVEGTEFEFYLDRKDDATTSACQTEDRTGHPRSIRRSSFHPYFTRAREASTTG